VREQIVTAVIGSNESKALRVVKPLYGTCCHFTSLLFYLTGRRPKSLSQVLQSQLTSFALLKDGYKKPEPKRLKDL